jgi:hypothetical protein
MKNIDFEEILKGPFMLAFRTFCMTPKIPLDSLLAKIDSFFPELENKFKELNGIER